MVNQDDLQAIKLLLVAILITLLGWWSVIGIVIGVLLGLYALAILIFKVDNVFNKLKNRIREAVLYVSSRIKKTALYNYISNSRRCREIAQAIKWKQSLGYETENLIAELEFLKLNRFKQNTFRPDGQD